MPEQKRETLKKYFQNGSLPTAGSFEDLIDSSVNIVDDGIDISDKDGLMLCPPEGNPAMTFFRLNQEPEPLWTTSLSDNGSETGLNFNEPTNEEGSRLFLENGGRVGVNTQKPQFALDVRGYVGMSGRVGTMAGEVPADRKWHTILEGLNEANAYEIVARTGVKDSGKHCLIHALALSTFGKSRAKIKKTKAFYSFWKPCNIKLRWAGSTFDYRLEIKCSQNLGDGVMIRYFITKLWEDATMSNVNLSDLESADPSSNPEASQGDSNSGAESSTENSSST